MSQITNLYNNNVIKPKIAVENRLCIFDFEEMNEHLL